MKSITNCLESGVTVLEILECELSLRLEARQDVDMWELRLSPIPSKLLCEASGSQTSMPSSKCTLSNLGAPLRHCSSLCLDIPCARGAQNWPCAMQILHWMQDRRTSCDVVSGTAAITACAGHESEREIAAEAKASQWLQALQKWNHLQVPDSRPRVLEPAVGAQRL